LAIRGAGRPAISRSLSDATLSDLLTAAAEQGLSGVVVSRATWFPDTAGATEVPVVGGRTVWQAVPDPTHVLFVIERPNFFGRFDPDPPDGATAISIDREDGQAGDARHLARSLTQIPGLRLPHGQPETPTFVVSVPGSAERVAGALSGAGFPGCTALGGRFPEFAGGLHVQVAWSREENPRFSAIVRSGV
jgi:hypothetical protein